MALIDERLGTATTVSEDDIRGGGGSVGITSLPGLDPEPAVMPEPDDTTSGGSSGTSTGTQETVDPNPKPGTGFTDESTGGSSSGTSSGSSYGSSSGSDTTSNVGDVEPLPKEGSPTSGKVMESCGCNANAFPSGTMATNTPAGSRAATTGTDLEDNPPPTTGTAENGTEGITLAGFTGLQTIMLLFLGSLAYNLFAGK